MIRYEETTWGHGRNSWEQEWWLFPPVTLENLIRCHFSRELYIKKTQKQYRQQQIKPSQEFPFSFRSLEIIDVCDQTHSWLEFPATRLRQYLLITRFLHKSISSLCRERKVMSLQPKILSCNGLSLNLSSNDGKIKLPKFHCHMEILLPIKGQMWLLRAWPLSQTSGCFQKVVEVSLNAIANSQGYQGIF